MKPRTLYGRCCVLIFLLLIIAFAGFADRVVNLMPDDVIGVASHVQMAQAQRNEVRAHHHHQVLLAAWREEQHRQWEYNHRKVTLIARNMTSPRSSRPRGGHHPVVPSPVQTDQYQNLSVAFVNPKGQPVSGIQIAAIVHPGHGPDIHLGSLTTDTNGRILLHKIGKLPASVDLAVAAAPQGAASPTKEEAEWRFADFHATSILLASARGVKVADREKKTPVLGFYQVASLRPVFSAGFSSRGAVSHRTVVYSDQQRNPVVLERTHVDLDVTAPSGSILTVPGQAEQTLPVPSTGHVLCHLPVEAVADGPLPLRVAMNLPGGEAESVVTSYATDPYLVNMVQAPPLQLVRLASVKIAQGADVFARREEVQRAFGKPGRIAKPGDGSEVWIYPKQQIGLELRALPFKEGKDNPWIVERLRVYGQSGGTFCGLAVGAGSETLQQTLGTPQIVNDTRHQTMDSLGDAGTVSTYLDGGLRICQRSGKMLWWEIARPSPLLLSGTTAFVQRPRARLYVESFQGRAGSSFPNMEALRRYLGQVHSVDLVGSRDQADLVLKAKVSGFDEDREAHSDDEAGDVSQLTPEQKQARQEEKEFWAGILVRYSCTTALTYTLTDALTGQAVVEDKEAKSTVTTDFRNETAIAALVATIGLAQKNDVIKILTGILIAGGVEELRKSMRRAINRSPAISAKSAFNEMVQDINRVGDYSVRVTGIDYLHNRLRLNVGTAQGIRVSTSDDPYEFQILVKGAPLSSDDSPTHADYETAVVVAADEQSCLCEMHHVKRRVDKGREKNEDSPDLKTVQQPPDPTTGLVSARAWVLFPSLPVVPDSEQTGRINPRFPRRLAAHAAHHLVSSHLILASRKRS